MPEAWEKAAQEHRTSELIDLIEEQKEKDVEHVARENAMDKKSTEKIVELSELIDVLAKHMLDLEKRVTELEEKVKS
jgi:hypothetical protein